MSEMYSQYRQYVSDTIKEADRRYPDSSRSWRVFVASALGQMERPTDAEIDEAKSA